MADLYEADDADVQERGRFEEEADDPDDKPIEDDEEIDEDEAFNEEDYEKYGSLDFKRKHRGEKAQGRRGKAAQSEALSDEEDDGEEAGGALWPNLDALGSAPDDEAPEPAKDAGDDEEDLGSSEEEEELAPEKESRLLALVTGSEVARKRKKRAPEQDEARAEGEFALGPRGGEKLSVADLVAPVEGNAAFGSLKKRVEGLQRTPALHAPLAEVVAERELRKAGYEKSAAAVSKFQPMVIAARRAEQLVFPLNAPAAVGASTASIAASVQPEAEWERDVAAMLAKEGLDGAKGTDELPDNAALTPEAAAARRAQLAKMKNRLFYAELKAKRQAKIKSKTYHKIAKREKLRRQAEEQAALAEADPEGAREAGAKVERERLKERMQLRHRNTSLWARNLLSKGARLNPANRAALAEANRISQELRRKMTSVNAEEEAQAEEVAMLAAAESGAAAEGEEAAGAGGKAAVEKGLFGMKFMQRGVARDAEAARRLEEGTDDYERQERERRERGDAPMRRQAFAGPAEGAAAAEEAEGGVRARVRFVEGTHQVQRAASEGGRVTRTKGPLRVGDGAAEAEVEEAAGEEAAAAPAAGGANGKQAAAEGDTTKRRRKERRNKGASEPLDKAADFVAVTANPWLSASAPSSSSSSSSTAPTAAAPAPAGKSAALPASVVAPAGGFHLLGQKSEAERSAQAELVARAFATGDLEADFEAEKAREAEEEAPTKKPDAALPGWGGWTGDGLRERPAKPAAKPAPAGPPAPPRRDKALAAVVISERRDAKGARFLAPAVPAGFADAAQYERALRMPLGPEWNTSAAHRKMTAPRVVVRTGAAIEPMKYSKRQHDAIQAPKLKRRKVPKNLVAGK